MWAWGNPMLNLASKQINTTFLIIAKGQNDDSILSKLLNILITEAVQMVM